jgi:preprotein translocase subunit SecE
VLHLRILSLVVVVVVYLFVSFIFEVDKALKSFLSNDRFC